MPVASTSTRALSAAETAVERRRLLPGAVCVWGGGGGGGACTSMYQYVYMCCIQINHGKTTSYSHDVVVTDQQE